MGIVWIIAKRELSSFFDSLMAYIILVLFLGLSGFFTWLYGSDIFLVGQANLKVFFAIASWTLLFFIPAITMKMIAEEKKTGTLELILTKPVTDRQLILGKYLGATVLVMIALFLTISYAITLANIANLDVGGTISGYLALVLLSLAYLGIGIFATSITSNQIVAFMAALFINVFFQLILSVLASSFTGSFGMFLDALSFQSHFEALSRGVIDTKDVFFFLSVVVLSLFFAERSLNKRHLSK